jgi:hypothetical protein
MNLAFIDLEASGLSENSFPLEIGWTKDGVNFKDYFIKPESDWDRNSWSQVAENLHGIHLADVEYSGLLCEDIAKEMNSDLQEFLLLSDSVTHDIKWVNMIFAAAKIERKFKIVSIESFLKKMGLNDHQIFQAFKYGRENFPPCNQVKQDLIFLYNSTKYAIKKK